MMKFLKILGGILALISTAAILWLGNLYRNYRQPPKITVINRSSHPLEQVRLSGTGFQTPIPNLPPNKSQTVQVHPTSESGCAITFFSAGKSYHAGEMGYLEPTGGYLLDLTVQPDFDVTCTTGIR